MHCSRCKDAHRLIAQLIVNKQPPEVADHPQLPSLRAIVQKCLELDPSARASGHEVVKVRT